MALHVPKRPVVTQLAIEVGADNGGPYPANLVGNLVQEGGVPCVSLGNRPVNGGRNDGEDALRRRIEIIQVARRGPDEWLTPARPP